MADETYVSEEDISQMLRDAFGISKVNWDIKHPDYDYLGLATCTAEIEVDNFGIKIVAFPCLAGYTQPGVPIYGARVISEMQNGNSVIESQIAQYEKKGIKIEKSNGKTVLKKTINAKTHHTDSVNTIDPEELKEAINEIRELSYELI